MARIPLADWHGTLVSRDMIAPLDELKRSTRPIILPIKGFGSYRGNAASGGTDTGSGHVDLNAEGVSETDALEVVRRGRQIGLAIFYRRRRWYSKLLKKWRQPGWQSHWHVLMEGSDDLSAAALAQLREYHAGGDGLVGAEPDDGDRTFVGRTWAAFLALTTPVVNVGKAVANAANAAQRQLLANIPVTLGKPIHMSNLRVGGRGADVSRYQAALWNRLPSTERAKFIKTYGLTRRDLYDGVYGKVTAAMTARLYVLIRLPSATEPGAKMMRHLGFTDVR